MKKYLLILPVVVFFLFSGLTQKNIAFSQVRGFEIYNPRCSPGANCTPYPLVDKVNIYRSGNYVVITAHAFDVSGILSLTAYVKNPGKPNQYINVEHPNFGNGVMYDDGSHNDGAKGDGIYGTIIDISNVSVWKDATYWVDISATDNLLNNSMLKGGDYVQIKSFVINNPVTTAEIWADKTESGWNGGATSFGDPYSTFYQDSRAQFIILASDLENIGMQPGDRIKSLYLRTYEQPGLDLINFTVKAKLTASAITTSWEGGWTNLYAPTDISKRENGLATAGNWKEYNFTKTFQWDGLSNIMVNISRDGNLWSYGGGMYVRQGIGSYRMFAGTCDGCKNFYGKQLSDWFFGADNGNTFDSCPELKIDYTHPKV